MSHMKQQEMYAITQFVNGKLHVCGGHFYGSFEEAEAQFVKTISAWMEEASKHWGDEWTKSPPTLHHFAEPTKVYEPDFSAMINTIKSHKSNVTALVDEHAAQVASILADHQKQLRDLIVIPAPSTSQK